MEYLSAKETSAKWGITPRRILVLYQENRIVGAKRIGNIWVIQDDAAKPRDARFKQPGSDAGPASAE